MLFQFFFIFKHWAYFLSCLFYESSFILFLPLFIYSVNKHSKFKIISTQPHAGDSEDVEMEDFTPKAISPKEKIAKKQEDLGGFTE